MATVNLERIWVPSRARQSSQPITESLALLKHAVIVGGPGSGKSTLLRRFAYQSASGNTGLPFLIPIGDLESFIATCQKGAKLRNTFLAPRLENCTCAESIS